MPIQIDPQTGERVQSSTVPQIDPATGERVSADTSAPAAPATPFHFGSSLSDIISTPLEHLGNMVAGPYHAFTDAPRDAREQSATLEAPDAGTLGKSMGQFNLGLYRMAAEPTVNGVSDAIDKYKQGDLSGAATSAAHAIPIIGPWAQGLQDDIQKKGLVAGLEGLGTDFLAPKIASKIAGGALRAGGETTRMASASPESLRLAATRKLVPGTPGELLNRALKPPVSYPDFEESAQEAMPSIVRQNPASGVQGFADAANRAKESTAQAYEKIKAPVARTRLNTTPMVAPQVESIPATNAFESPGIIGSTRRIASAYDMTPTTRTVTSPILDERGNPITTTETVTPKMPTLREVDDIRKDTNSKLRSFYNQEGGDQRAALSSPATARMKAVNDGARDLVYKRLSDASGIPEEDIRANQDMYGHLSDVSDVAGKRATVHGRQSPFSLQESLAMNGGNPFHAAANFIGQRVLKGVTNPDSLVNSAVDRFKYPDGTPLLARPGIAPRVGMGLGEMQSGVGKGLSGLPLKANPLFYSNANSRN